MIAKTCWEMALGEMLSKAIKKPATLIVLLHFFLVLKFPACEQHLSLFSGHTTLSATVWSYPAYIQQHTCALLGISHWQHKPNYFLTHPFISSNPIAYIIHKIIWIQQYILVAFLNHPHINLPLPSPTFKLRILFQINFPLRLISFPCV